MADEPPDRERDEEEDRPRSRRREDEDYEEDDRPRRRRRRRDDDEEVGDEGHQYVIPINTSGLAIAAGYVGLISVLCFPAPFALLLGILALVQLRKNPKLHGKGRAIFAIVMGGLFTILPVILLLLGALSGWK